MIQLRQERLLHLAPAIAAMKPERGPPVKPARTPPTRATLTIEDQLPARPADAPQPLVFLRGQLQSHSGAVFYDPTGRPADGPGRVSEQEEPVSCAAAQSP